MQNKDEQQEALSPSLMLLYIVIRRETPCRFAESKVNAGIGDVEKRRRRPQPVKVTMP